MRKPPKYCVVHPCNRLALPGSSWCQEHKRPAPAKQADAFYLSPQWRRFRDWFISRHPLCQQCEAEGRTEPAVIVDHVVELKDGGAPYSEDNAQSLCRSCHNRKTAGERRKRGPVVYSYEKSSATFRE